MKLKQGSWHYRLADTYGKGEFDRRTDLCSYLSRFMLGSFFALCAVMLGTFVGFIMVLAPGLWIAACLIEWHYFAPDDVAIFGLSAWAIVGGFVGFAWWTVHREDQNKPWLPVPAPLREAYRGWKEKYCPVVEFVGH